MTQEQQVPSKAELIDALRSSERELLQRLQALQESQLEQGRYENGWNGRQILAHVASIEWTYPRLIDIARQAAAPKEEPPPQAKPSEPAQAAALPTRTAQGGILSYNDRQVEKRADASVAELLAEFQKNRAATIAAVEEADESLFTTPIQSAGGIAGPLANVIQGIAVLHVLGHVNDIVGEQPG